MLQMILNTDDTKYGGQGLIEEGQYLQRTINRRYSLSWIFLYLSNMMNSGQFWYSSTYGAVLFSLCRVDGLQNCLRVPLPSRTAQVGTYLRQLFVHLFFWWWH